MKLLRKIAAATVPALFLAAFSNAPVHAQTPAVVAPIVVDTAVPIIVGAIKPKKTPSGLGKFEGFVMHSNIAEITVRAKGNDLSIETFSLSQKMSAKMQTIVDKGGYQYGDKVTVYYDPTSKQAVNIKGKPSKAI